MKRNDEDEREDRDEMKIHDGEHLPAANIERVRRAGSSEWVLF